MLISVFAAIPVLTWALMLPLSGRFAGLSASFRSLGQVSGLLGLALLSINFILSARFKFLDRWFLGLNKVYLKHHIVGALSFGLILLHPVFLTVQFLIISLPSAYLFIFSFDSWALNFGKIGLSIFVAIMVITFYMSLRYERWKSTHQYLGLVLFFGGVHSLFMPSDISNNLFLKSYMLALTFCAALSYGYRTIFKLYRRNEYKYELSKVVKVSEKIAELKFRPLGKKIDFIPGQFVFIRFDSKNSDSKEGKTLAQSHPFSIISDPASQELSLGVKALGDYTSLLSELAPGQVVSIEGPFGSFSHTKASSKKQIWVAGGIGITPFLGMARAMKKEGAADYKIDLYYSIRNASEAAFGSELMEIAGQNRNFRFHEYFSGKNGLISAELVAKESDLSGADVFLCGPADFMKSLREQFIKLGMNGRFIHSEEFSLN